MVGNGVTTWEYDTLPAYIEMAYQHGLYSTTMEREKEELNCDFSYIFFDDNHVSQECSAWYQKFSKLTRNINMYEIYNGNGSELLEPQMYGPSDAVPMDDAPMKLATFGDYTPWAFSDLNSV